MSSESDTTPDFVLDPSDPLYMLLNNTHDPKPDGTFDYSLPMDFDFNDPSLAAFINPNALFIDGKASLQAPPAPVQPQDLLNAAYPFFSSPTLSSASASADESAPGLSPSSPGSSSSARASPAAPALPKSMAAAVPGFFSQSVGPFATPFQSQPTVQHPLPPSPLPPQVHATQGPQTHVINTLVTGRPKTSHTTIERRYRTNLNARIQSLKAAVPALRVLDQNCKNDEYKVDDRGYIDGVKVARKGSKANVLGKAVEYIRVLKRREARLKREQDGLRTLICGFAGGQSILSEWEIEWTKKFGGPEKDEIDYEGAEEASDDEDGDGDGEDDGDASERARKKPKVETSKKEKRKIAPAVPVPVPAGEIPGTTPGAVGEKRKRGRPRKIQPNVPPPSAPAAPVMLTNPCQQGVLVPPPVAQAPPQQYLLAVLALFSFFNSPLTSTTPSASHHHTHQGAVLSHATPALSAQPTLGWTWDDIVQIIHLFASLAVFASIVIPWIPIPRKVHQSRLMQLISFAPFICPARVGPSREMSDLPTPPDSPNVSDAASDPDSSSSEYTVRATKDTSNPLADALGSRGAGNELENLLSALKISTGWAGIVCGSIGVLPTQRGPGTRRERRAWTRLAELLVLSSDKTSLSVRWQVYNHLSIHLPFRGSEAASETLVSDLCTFALLSQSLPFTGSRSQALWARANRLAESFEVSAYQRLVLGSMTVGEAVERLVISPPVSGSSPLEVLASTLLHKRLHSHASSLFIQRVSRGQEIDNEVLSDEASETREATLSYGRSLGGDIGLLCDALAKVSQDGSFSLDIDLKVDPASEDVIALLRATHLYNQVFAGQSVLSPPPSPPPKAGDKESEGDVVLHLRRVLGSNVFEQSGESNTDSLSLEDARDRVVDMIVNLQRERRIRVV